MASFVLVHGAWHGGWCWHKVVAEFTARGNTAAAPDLPGHGDDRTPPEQVDLDAYVTRVCDVIDAQTRPVVLVGHSMGGIVITQVAEYRADAIASLVYLAAVIPGGGETFAAAAPATAEVAEAVELAGDGLAVGFRANAAPLIFYADCSEEDVAYAAERLCPQPTGPMQVPLSLTKENAGRVPRVYIECLQDRAISLLGQRELCAKHPCRSVYTLDTSHSPFFSAPRELAGILLEVSEAAG